MLAALREEGACEPGRDYYILGNGSNVLVSDSGFRGVVLHLSKEYGNMILNGAGGTRLVCESGAPLAAVAHRAYECGLTGFEFAAGIPGSLGGAIVMNAGAYGGEMRQVVESVLDVTLALAPGSRREIGALMEDLASRRREKQPLEYPSAGSTFKRPPGHFAAKLIEEAGLRGFSVGGAQVSEKHCGFVVNKGNATAADIYALITKVQEQVKRSSQVTLEPEVILLGF